jgi:large subunit ribosomal protein L17
MFRNMVTSLLACGRVKTTDAKAKEVRRWADQMISLAKRGDLHARRQALSVIREKDIVHGLFAEARTRFAQAGGYTRVIKIGLRKGDAAPVSLVELVGAEEGSMKKPGRQTGAKGKKSRPAAGRKAKKEVAAQEPQAPEAPKDAEAPQNKEP